MAQGRGIRTASPWPTSRYVCGYAYKRGRESEGCTCIYIYYIMYIIYMIASPWLLPFFFLAAAEYAPAQMHLSQTGDHARRSFTLGTRRIEEESVFALSSIKNVV